MLELKDIMKHYNVGGTVTKALDGVSVSFRKTEFVSILGASGSGKTTLLNIIGGLDQYDSGDMIINGKSTKSFKANDWDAYRNNSIGFVFQNYNLIGHLGIIDNVELGMTLSGVSKEEKREKAKDALIKVGLKDHMHKKPNQLSGGQMQRVAIARAIANDPDILLCDEPTGALDSETSTQIMDLIQTLSKEKLVIMVTHNPTLANQYSDRTIEFKDGRIKSDSHPHQERPKADSFILKRTKMSFWTALKLSFNNIRTKKGRTFLTAFASSIGIIGIGIVLSLSNGFQKQINQTQAETIAQFPITIRSVVVDQNSAATRVEAEEVKAFPTTTSITAKQNVREQLEHINTIDEEYLNYLKKMNPALSNSIGYTRLAQMNLLRKVNDTVETVSFSASSSDSMMDMSSVLSAATGIGISAYPEGLDGKSNQYLEKNYDVIAGEYPSNNKEIVMIVNEYNEINMNVLSNLGFKIEDGQAIAFDDLVGIEVKVVPNDNYYAKLPTGGFVPNQELSDVYNKEHNIDLKVVGVLRAKENSSFGTLSEGIAYSDSLARELITINKESEIVKAQIESDKNVMTGETINEGAKENFLNLLGASETPNSVMIYPNNFKDKAEVLTYLDEYNDGKEDEDKIYYSDLAGTMTSLTGGLMDAITTVLIAFAAISLVTSMIMIAIIMYTSVIERTKEIGVLKALGARKKDITRVFDAETFILGGFSGILGVAIAYLATFPINHIIYQITELENVAQLDPIHALILVVISTILTIIAGHVPARMAAKKDAAIALRTE